MTSRVVSMHPRLDKGGLVLQLDMQQACCTGRAPIDAFMQC